MRWLEMLLMGRQKAEDSLQVEGVRGGATDVSESRSLDGTCILKTANVYRSRPIGFPKVPSSGIDRGKCISFC